MTQADHMKTIELAITTLRDIGDVDDKELSYHATGALAAIKQRLEATPQAVPNVTAMRGAFYNEMRRQGYKTMDIAAIDDEKLIKALLAAPSTAQPLSDEDLALLSKSKVSDAHQHLNDELETASSGEVEG